MPFDTDKINQIKQAKIDADEKKRLEKEKADKEKAEREAKIKQLEAKDKKTIINEFTKKFADYLDSTEEWQTIIQEDLEKFAADGRNYALHIKLFHTFIAEQIIDGVDPDDPDEYLYHNESVTKELHIMCKGIDFNLPCESFAMFSSDDCTNLLNDCIAILLNTMLYKGLKLKTSIDNDINCSASVSDEITRDIFEVTQTFYTKIIIYI